MQTILDAMYNETAAIQADMQLCNDLSMAQAAWRMHEEGRDVDYLLAGHPERQWFFTRMVEAGAPVLTNDVLKTLFN